MTNEQYKKALEVTEDIKILSLLLEEENGKRRLSDETLIWLRTNFEHKIEFLKRDFREI